MWMLRSLPWCLKFTYGEGGGVPAFPCMWLSSFQRKPATHGSWMKRSYKVAWSLQRYLFGGGSRVLCPGTFFFLSPLSVQHGWVVQAAQSKLPFHGCTAGRASRGGNTRDLVGICGLGMTNVSLSLTHRCLYQPGASEQLGANRLSVVSDLSWSLARREALRLQAPAGARRRGVLSAGPADPSGAPACGGSHLYRSLLNVNMSLLRERPGEAGMAAQRAVTDRTLEND